MEMENEIEWREMRENENTQSCHIAKSRRRCLTEHGASVQQQQQEKQQQQESCLIRGAGQS